MKEMTKEKLRGDVRTRRATCPRVMPSAEPSPQLRIMMMDISFTETHISPGDFRHIDARGIWVFISPNESMFRVGAGRFRRGVGWRRVEAEWTGTRRPGTSGRRAAREGAKTARFNIQAATKDDDQHGCRLLKAADATETHRRGDAVLLLHSSVLNNAVSHVQDRMSTKGTSVADWV